MIGFILRRRLKRDIRRIGRHLKEITYTDTNAQLTTDTFDKDVSELSKNINQMLERNRRDLFEKVRAEADLKRAVTNISHDLRTPLTSALGYLQMLENPALDEETKARYLATVKGRLDALSSLMNSLFEFARVLEGNMSLDMRQVNVGSLLRDTLSAGYSELLEKGFDVEADIPDAPVFFLCDSDAMRRVLQNLIKNAAVHGKEFLRIRLTDGVIEIANKADGLAELDTERIFERFYTADASRTSKNTGLGLAITKELAGLLGLDISAEVAGGMMVVRVMAS